MDETALLNSLERFKNHYHRGQGGSVSLLYALYILKRTLLHP